MQLVKENTAKRTNILIYGPAGSGKSYSIATLPGRVLVLQTEPGFVSSLEDPSFKRRVDDGECVVLLIESWQDLEPLKLGLHQFLTKAGLTNSFDAVVLDSVSWAAELAKEAVLRQYPTKTGLPELQQWQLITENVRQVVRSLLRFEGITVIIAQADARDVETPTGAQSMWVPGMPGRYATRIAHDIDVVLFSRRALDGTFVVETAASGARIAKVRGKELQKVLPLDLTQIIKEVTNDGTGTGKEGS